MNLEKDGNLEEILIVEDSLTQAEELKFLLEKNNYKVAVANKGKDALFLLKNLKPSVIISDIIMPEMDGYQFCKHIKTSETLKKIPVILLTSLSDPRDVLKGLECGADNFITKPYDEKNLISRLKYLIINRQLRESDKVQMGVEVVFGGQKYFITAERQQILDLLFSTYETAVWKNIELIRVQEELKALNERLEEKVDERTSALKAEIEVRKKAESALKHRLEVEKTISNISTRFLMRSDFDNAVSTSLAEMGRLSGASRSYLFLIRDDGTIMDNTHEWCADGVLPEIQNLQNLQVSLYPWWMKRLRAGEVVQITNVSGLPPEASAEKEILEMQNIKSLLVLPVLAGAELIGFIGFDNVKTTGFWREEDIILLRIASEIIGNAYQRKRAEEALQNSEARLQLQINRMPIGYIVWDSEFHVISWNPAAEEIFGFNVEEVLGKHPYDLIVPRDAQPRVETIWRRLLEGDTTAHSVNENITKDGSTIICSWSNTPIKEADGTVLGVLSMVQDITERKRAEEALHNSEERYRTIIENSNDLIWTLDREGNFQFINKRAEEITGYKVEDWLGKTFVPLINREDIPYIMEVFQKTISGQHLQCEVNIKRQDGSDLLMSVNTAPVYLKEDIIGIVSFGRDITESRKAEETKRENERLVYASKAKSEFLASMSHELRTPLNSIIGFSELLKEKTTGELNEKQEHYINNAITSSKFLLNLINDILDLSKVEAGKIDLAVEKVSLPETLDETIVLIKERAMKHNVVIKKEFDSQLNFMEADKHRLKQILFNLISNAIKFSKKEGGTVTITTKKVKDMAQISISDTGIGIREEDLGKLFKEFGQANPGISKEYGGTGLGLTISKKLVELHGGKIWVESKYGEGTKFIFTLPLVDENEG